MTKTSLAHPLGQPVKLRIGPKPSDFLLEIDGTKIEQVVSISLDAPAQGVMKLTVEIFPSELDLELLEGGRQQVQYQ